MRRRLLLVAWVTWLACASLPTTSDAVETPRPTIAWSELERGGAGAVPTSFVLDVDRAGATAAKLVVDGRYVGADATPPLTFDVALAPGTHRFKVRVVVNGVETRSDADVSVAEGIAGPSPDASIPVSIPGEPTTPSPSVPTTPVPTTPVPTTPVPTDPGDLGPPAFPTPTARPGDLVVDTVAEIRAALATARPGDVIFVADGEYQFRPRLVAAASGTATAPIVLRGSRDAVIRTKNASGDYGLHVTGDHWRIEGITVAHATKGIVLDGSVGTVIDGVEVYDIGAEAVHFRTCSSDGVLRRSYIHDTGRTNPQYGEGVYVGSANSNWGSFACVDAVEGRRGGDNTERVLIEDNLFEDTTAEGADLKEGTDSGTLRRNVFRRSGTSGMNSADSAVDAKGNNWIIVDNVVVDTAAAWDDDGVARPSEFLDGFQTHRVYEGYGTGNVFRGNVVIGRIPGFVVGTYPMLANTVACSNAGDAAKGLVGDGRRSVACAR